MGEMVAALREAMSADAAPPAFVPTSTVPAAAAPPPPVARPAPLPASQAADKPLGTPVLDELRVRGAAVFREIATFGEPPPTKVACLSPIGDLFATAGADGSIRVWDLRSRTRTAVLRTEMQRRTGHDAIAICMDFRSDGVVLATGHVDGAVRLWDMRSGDEIPARLRHEDIVSAVAFSPDG